MMSDPFAGAYMNLVGRIYADLLKTYRDPTTSKCKEFAAQALREADVLFEVMIGKKDETK